MENKLYNNYYFNIMIRVVIYLIFVFLSGEGAQAVKVRRHQDTFFATSPLLTSSKLSSTSHNCEDDDEFVNGVCLTTPIVCKICTPDGCMDPSYKEFSMEVGGHDQSECRTKLTQDNIKVKYEEEDNTAKATFANEIRDAQGDVEKKQKKLNAYRTLRDQQRIRAVEARKLQKQQRRDNTLVSDPSESCNVEAIDRKARTKATRVRMSKEWLSYNTKFKRKLKYEVAIAMSETESAYDNECYNNNICCCSYDIGDDNEDTATTLVTVADKVGAWSVLCEGSQILSRQIRTSKEDNDGNSNYTMTCWDGNDFSQAQEATSGNSYECNGHEILVGSQAIALTCPNVTGGTCNTCSDNTTCTDVTCDANNFNDDNNHANGCEVGCPTVAGGTCDACSDNTTCTSVTCDDNNFNDDNNHANGCELGCPTVVDGTCNTCSDKDTCTAVTCDDNKFNNDTNHANGCELGCPPVAHALCTACTLDPLGHRCTQLTCDSGYVNANDNVPDGCEVHYLDCPTSSAITAMGTTPTFENCQTLKRCYNDNTKCNGSCGSKSQLCESYALIHNSYCQCQA